MTIKRHIDPFRDTTAIADKQLPFIRAQRVLLRDPALIERLKHIARPYRGGEALDRASTPEQNEPQYVDLEMMVMVLLNEVQYLRDQIGLVCSATHQATAGQFRIDPTGPYRGLHETISDRRPAITDFIANKKTTKR